MKKLNIPFLLVGLVLIVILAGCGMTQPGYGDEQYPDRTIRNRSIYSDSYYGGSRIVRDPYTGQYYEVIPVGPAYGYDPYGYRYPANTYGRNPYYGRSGGRYSTSSPRRNTSTGRTQPRQEQNSGSTTTQKAKDIIKGNNR